MTLSPELRSLKQWASLSKESLTLFATAIKTSQPQDPLTSWSNVCLIATTTTNQWCYQTEFRFPDKHQSSPGIFFVNESAFSLFLWSHIIDSGSSEILASMIWQEVSSAIAALFQQQQILQPLTPIMLPIASPQQPHISHTMPNFDSLLPFNVPSESRNLYTMSLSNSTSNGPNPKCTFLEIY